jgi:hypothetical protein
MYVGLVVLSGLNFSYRIVSCRIMSRLVLSHLSSCLVSSRLVSSCLVSSCLALSCLVSDCLVSSCLVFSLSCLSLVPVFCKHVAALRGAKSGGKNVEGPLSHVCLSHVPVCLTVRYLYLCPLYICVRERQLEREREAEV